MDDLLRDAKAEAKRFLDRVTTFEVHAKLQDHNHYACPERAAIRRASLDLTRALARMRRY